jgi:hypothetical protein
MRARFGLLTIAIAALAASPASAEPYKTSTLDAAAPKYDWDGSGSGVSKPFGLVGEPSNLGCGSFPDGNDCQDILLKLDAPGDLTVTLDIADAESVPDPTGIFGGSLAGYPDIDMYPYKADASGAPTGDPLSTDAATAEPSETFTLKNLAKGSYVVQVEFFNGVEASYTASAVLSNFPAPEPVVVTTPEAPAAPAAPAAQPQAAPAPAAQPAEPAAKKKPSKKAACVKKAKKVKKAKARKKALAKCKKLKG